MKVDLALSVFIVAAEIALPGSDYLSMPRPIEPDSDTGFASGD